MDPGSSLLPVPGLSPQALFFRGTHGLAAGMPSPSAPPAGARVTYKSKFEQNTGLINLGGLRRRDLGRKRRKPVFPDCLLCVRHFIYTVCSSFSF